MSSHIVLIVFPHKDAQILRNMSRSNRKSEWSFYAFVLMTSVIINIAVMHMMSSTFPLRLAALAFRSD